MTCFLLLSWLTDGSEYLAHALRQELPPALLLAALGVAFGLGALHALAPGHGKTIVAAYLVGSRGTPGHAALLGAVVTFTHTLSVFLLGIGVLLFEKTVLPERVIPLLGVVSGLSVAAIGLYLLLKRWRGVAETHQHAAFPEPEPVQGGGLRFLPAGTRLTHSHGGSPHTHQLPEEITLGGLFALGVSGGLVPCPSALVLMLSAIGLGRTLLGLGLLVAFSAGLALVLMAIGVTVLFAKGRLPLLEGVSGHPLARWVPVGSALVVTVAGLVMAWTAWGR